MLAKKLLKMWLCQVLIENPETIDNSTKTIEVYQKLYDIWFPDIQKALKGLAKEATKEKTEEPF